MEYSDIQNKELKTVLHLFDIMQNSRSLSAKEKQICDTLHASFPEISDERRTIFDHIHSLRWIEVPESFPNNRGGRDYFMIDNPHIQAFIRITSLGEEELAKLLPFAENWLLKKEQSENIDNLKKQLIESQLESIKFAKQTTKETIIIAKSAKYAAWASAIGAIVTALLALIALLFNIFTTCKPS